MISIVFFFKALGYFVSLRAHKSIYTFLRFENTRKKLMCKFQWPWYRQNSHLFSSKCLVFVIVQQTILVSSKLIPWEFPFHDFFRYPDFVVQHCEIEIKYLFITSKSSLFENEIVMTAVEAILYLQFPTCLLHSYQAYFFVSFLKWSVTHDLWFD